MKKIIIQESEEGLSKLLGEYITVYCESFIYAGTLSGINESCILLTKAAIVYDTGSHKDKGWSVSEDIPGGDWYIQISKIESFGKLKDRA